MTIQINDKDYILEYSFRAQFLFERVSKDKECTASESSCLFFYCCLLIKNKGFNMEWADFIDYLDSHHELYAKFNDMMSEALDFDKKKAETTDS